MIRPIEKNHRLIIQLTGFLFFGTLAILSLFFYRERMITFDPSFFAYQIIESKSYCSVLGRWGSVLSQILPVYALRRGCSLDTFLELYSISFILLYYLNFLLITAVLRNYRAGMALMLILCLAFRHAFYYSTAELYQGMSIVILIWALISPENERNEYRNPVNKRLAFLCAAGLVYVVSFFHQLALFPLLFIIALEIILNQKYRDKLLVGLFIFTLVWFSIRIALLTNSEYEKNKIPGLQDFLTYLPRLGGLTSTKYFLKFAWNNLWSLALVFIFVGLACIQRKTWLLLCLFISFPLGFLVLTLVTYHNGESPLMYENYFTVLGFFAGISLMVILGKIYKGWPLLLLIPLLAFNVREISRSHSVFTKRIGYLNRLAKNGQESGKRKMVLSASNFPWEYGWVKWALPFETLLASSLDDPDRAVTAIAPENINQYDSLLAKENIFLGPEWEVLWFSQKSQDKDLFRLPDTPYEKVNSPQSDTTFKEAAFNRENVRIIPLKSSVRKDMDPYVVIPVKILNSSGARIHSLRNIPNSVSLCYHVYDKAGKLLSWDGPRTPLETDIDKETTASVRVEVPKQKGSYTVKIDFVTEGKRWWGINAEVTLLNN